MSSLIEFDDLGSLSAVDLLTVLTQAPVPMVLDALAGSAAGLRRRLLQRLPGESCRRLEAQLAAHGPVALESVRAAQLGLIEVLRRLAQQGIVAFDDPADMTNMVA